MESLFQTLQVQYPFIVQYKYALFFLGAALEGMNTMIVAGFLYSANRVFFLPTFIVLVLGYCIHGYIWYLVGFLGGGNAIDWWASGKPKRRELLERIRSYFEKYTGPVIVFAKATLSLTMATLILAGFLKYDIKKFSLYNFLGSAAWVGITFFVGYFFGAGFEFFFQYLRDATYVVFFLVAAIILVSLVSKGVANFAVRSATLAEHLRTVSTKIREEISNFVSPRKNDMKQ